MATNRCQTSSGTSGYAMSSRFKNNSNRRDIPQMTNYYIKKKATHNWIEVSKPSFFKLLYHEVNVYSHVEVVRALKNFPIEGLDHHFRITEGKQI